MKKTILKKIIITILSAALMLSASGCRDSAPRENTRAKELGYFYYPNTDWGMTADELFDAVNKRNLKYSFSREEEKITAIRKYYTEFVVLGDKVTVGFELSASPTNKTQRLSSVKWGYERDFTEEKRLEVMDKLDGLFEEQGIPVSSEWVSQSAEDGYSTRYTKESIAKKTDLPQEIKDSYNKAMKDIYASGRLKLPPVEDYANTDFIETKDKPLCSVTVVVLNDQEKGYVTLNGTPIKDVLEYTGAFEE